MADEKERGQVSDAPATAHATSFPAGDVVVTFSTFLLGLSTQALVLLGEIPNPASGAVEIDLMAAKQVIDIVGVLETKTQGNLDPAEQGLIESVLYELRMRYVEIVRRESKEAT
jgi:hypothetical protein